MLIDASHVEEIRVALLSNEKLEGFGFETSTKKQLKGNIYLARVVRVEPWLQAAFVDFGGNRHGVLAVNEIHPDYCHAFCEAPEKLLMFVPQANPAEKAPVTLSEGSEHAELEEPLPDPPSASAESSPETF